MTEYCASKEKMGLMFNRQHVSYRFGLLVFCYIICNVAVVRYRQTQHARDKAINSTSFVHHKQSENDLTQGANNTHRKVKVILFWNAFFKADDYRFGVGNEPFLRRGCRVSSCETTTSRTKLQDADVVVFHGPRIDDFPPPIRPPGQIYVYVQEKPNYNPSVAHMSILDGHMNITMTNRRDSDIEFPHARVVIDEDKTKSKRGRVDPRSRPRAAVWVVHRCSTPSRREWYVRELKKYFDVDIFGGCSDTKCPEEEGEDDQECLNFFQENYLFYLALEYDVCRDYVSEKIYKSFKKQIVPIVFGGANYSYAAPPKSVIDIRNFPHPKDLAEYLQYLSNDEDAYNEYLEWKNTNYDMVVGREEILGENFCRLCEIIHDPSYQYRDYSNLKGWWLDGICDASVMPRMRRIKDW